MYFKIFSVAVLICSAYGVVTGNAEECASAIIEGAASAVTLLIGIGGLLCFWSGISRILQGSRVSVWISTLLSPLTRIILGKDYHCKEVRDETSMLICANLLGLANAATPIALSLMQKLDSKTESPNASSVSVALSSCSPPALIPMTVLTVLSRGGCKDPFAILPYTWVCSSLSFLFALLLGQIYRTIKREK